MNAKVVIVGSSNVDMVVRSERLPAPGETILGGDFMMNSGGKGANQAVAFSRLSQERPVFISKVGNDLFGKNLMEVLQKENIDTEYVFSASTLPTGIALIIVDKNGENNIVVASGSNADLNERDIDKAKNTIENAEIVLLQLEIPMETVEYVAELVFRKGGKVVLNPAPMRIISDELMKKLYAIILNGIEAEMIAGVKISNWESARYAADIISEKGVENVIITMGSKGAFVKSSEIYSEVPAEKRIVVDTTAAGDTFCGAFCVGISESLSVIEAVKMANVAAGISVTKEGAQNSIPYRKEISLI